MAITTVKQQQIARQALALLQREIVLPALVWRDAIESFKGALNDTVSIRVPAYTAARTRTLRGGRPITMDDLAETKIDVTLDTDVYKAVAITDEELSLDITDFGAQVSQPIMQAEARGIEDALITEIQGGNYAVSIEVDNADPYGSLVDARKALNDARVPKAGRVLAVGSSIEAKLLKSDKLSRVDASGSDSALRDATLGRIAGFVVVTPDGLHPDEGYAFHKTAFVLATVAPDVPRGATWAQKVTEAGLEMRVLQDYDFLNLQDRFVANCWCGTGTTKDNGYIDRNGQFQPATDDADAPSQTGVTGVAATDVITLNGHGFANGDTVKFSALTGGAGLSTGTVYFVRDRAANTFKLAATAGGVAIDFTTDITAGTIAETSNELFVRAVKLTDAA